MVGCTGAMIIPAVRLERKGESISAILRVFSFDFIQNTTVRAKKCLTF